MPRPLGLLRVLAGARGLEHHRVLALGRLGHRQDAVLAAAQQGHVSGPAKAKAKKN